MPKTITIDDPAYELLGSSRRGPGDSFTNVILRHLSRRADAAGELLEERDKAPKPNVE